MKQISILLTKYNDWTSTFVYYIAGRGYTHSSISLEDDPDTFYSFNYRGFAIETVEKHRRRGVLNSCSVTIEISDEEYDLLRLCIYDFMEKKDTYKYTHLGALCCALRIPIRFQNAYFCSHFVAEVLEQSGAVRLDKKPWRHIPNNFIQLLEEHDGFIETRINPV